MVRLSDKIESDAVEALKRAALRLFAARGVDGVTVREIAAAAGQRNHGAVGYHFGSKAELISALVVDGASLIDARRNAMLDELETSGGPIELEDIIGIMVYPSVDIAPEGQEECFNRFIVLYAMAYRTQFLETLGGKWNTGYKRCLGHLRGFMQHLPRARQSERLVFLESCLGSVLANREARLADHERAPAGWAKRALLEHLVSTLAAIVRAP